MTLVVPRDRMAFSNMPERVVTDLPGGKLREFQFMPSPKVKHAPINVHTGYLRCVQYICEGCTVVAPEGGFRGCR